MPRKPHLPIALATRIALTGVAGFLLVSAPASWAQTVPSPVPSVLPHPGFDNVDVLPTAWKNQERKAIGGIALLPDGRMVTTIWRGGDLNNRNGEAHFLSNVLTARSGAEVTTTTLSTTLLDPLGVNVLDGKIYILEKDRLTRFDPNGTGWTNTLEYNGHNPFSTRYFYHWFSMGLVHHGGKFHWTLGGFTQYRDFVDPDPLKHGTWVEYDPAAKSHRFLVHGLRNTGGISLGPDGTLCTTDNQGEWMPTNKFICMEEGKWYGWDGPEALARQGRSETPPTVWNTYNDLGNSPGQTLLLTKGRYAGQMLMTDVNRAWLTRINLEKVKGHWQGANMFFSGGFNSGTFRIIPTPDSLSFIVAGVGGNGGGWKYGNTYTSLHRLTPNAKTVFEILTVRNQGPSGFDVEFTAPAASAAGTAAGYAVTSWKNIANNGYGGGHKQLMKTHTVTGVQLSADGRKASLTISGLEEGRIVRIQSKGLRSTAGDTLWTPFADYTLNAFGPGTTGIGQARGGWDEATAFGMMKTPGGLQLDLRSAGRHRVALRTAQGRVLVDREVQGPGRTLLAGNLSGPGLYVLTIQDPRGRTVSRTLSRL